jgi:hypothetical protein
VAEVPRDNPLASRFEKVKDFAASGYGLAVEELFDEPAEERRVALLGIGEDREYVEKVPNSDKVGRFNRRRCLLVSARSQNRHKLGRGSNGNSENAYDQVTKDATRNRLDHSISLR